MRNIQSKLCMSIAMCIAMAGCASKPIIKYQSVPVEVIKYVPLPDKLTAPCPVPMPQNDTVAEAVSVAHARRVIIETCANAKLDAIRSVKSATSSGRP